MQAFTHYEYMHAYRTAIAAEDAWSNELVRVYGAKRAGDARFTKLGRATPGLARLSAARDAAIEEWRPLARVLASR